MQGGTCECRGAPVSARVGMRKCGHLARSPLVAGPAFLTIWAVMGHIVTNHQISISGTPVYLCDRGKD